MVPSHPAADPTTAAAVGLNDAGRFHLAARWLFDAESFLGTIERWPAADDSHDYREGARPCSSSCNSLTGTPHLRGQAATAIRITLRITMGDRRATPAGWQASGLYRGCHEGYLNGPKPLSGSRQAGEDFFVTTGTQASMIPPAQ